MQNQVSFDHRVYKLIKLIDDGRYRNVLKKIQKFQSPSANLNENISYSLVKSMAIYKRNKPGTTHHQSFEEAKALIKEHKVIDDSILRLLRHVLREIGEKNQLKEIYADLQKQNPNNEHMSTLLFKTSCHDDDFFEIQKRAAEISQKFQKPKYSLYQCYAMYMIDKYLQRPGFGKLAIMNLDGMIKNQKATMNVNLLKTYIQLLSLQPGEENSKRIHSLLDENESLFQLKLDKINIETEVLIEEKKYGEIVDILIPQIQGNYNNSKEFECIFEFNEKFIVSLLTFLEEKGFNFQSFSLTNLEFKEEEIPECTEEECKHENPSPLLEESICSIDPSKHSEYLEQLYHGLSHLYSMKHKSLSYSDKVNRNKSLLLSQLFLKHKLYLKKALISPSLEEANETNNPFMKEIETFLIEFGNNLSSFVEIQPFLHYLNTTCRIALLKRIQEHIIKLQEKEVDDGFYLFNILFYKFQSVFLLFKNESNLEFKKIVPQTSPKEIIKIILRIFYLYEECRKYELNKQATIEKGERRIGDEFIIIIDHLMESLASNPEGVVDSFQRLKLAFLHEGLRFSPNNFDIELRMMKTCISNQLDFGVEESWKKLTIKGVQMESMGFIMFKYLFESGHLMRLAAESKKYNIFFKRNMDDIGDSKFKALEDENFAQVEELYLYQKHYSKSHQNFYIQILSYLIKISDSIDDKKTKLFPFIEDSLPVLLRLYDSISFPLFKNQDVQQFSNKLKYIPEVNQLGDLFSFKNPYGLTEMDDKWNLFANDPILSLYRYSFKNNYKENVMNIFGIFDEAIVLELVFLGTITGAAYYKVNKSEEEKSKHSENFETIYKRWNSLQEQVIQTGITKSPLNDCYAHDFEMLLCIMDVLKSLINCGMEFHKANDNKMDETILDQCLGSLKELFPKIDKCVQNVLSLISKPDLFSTSEIFSSLSQERKPLIDQYNNITLSNFRKLNLALNLFVPMISYMMLILQDTHPKLNLNKKKKNNPAGKKLQQIKNLSREFDKQITSIYSGFTIILDQAKQFRVPEEYELSLSNLSAIKELFPDDFENLKIVVDHMENYIPLSKVINSYNAMINNLDSFRKTVESLKHIKF